jgi:hypothetical protein
VDMFQFQGNIVARPVSTTHLHQNTVLDSSSQAQHLITEAQPSMSAEAQLDMPSIQDRFELLRKRRESLLDKTPPQSPLVEKTDAAAGPFWGLPSSPAEARSKAPVLLARPTSSSRSSSTAQSFDTSRFHESDSTPRQTPHTFDTSHRHSADLEDAHIVDAHTPRTRSTKPAPTRAPLPPLQVGADHVRAGVSAEVQGQSMRGSFQDTSRGGQAPLVPNDQASLSARNHVPNVIVNHLSHPRNHPPSSPIVPTDHGSGMPPMPGLGMRVKEKGDGTVYINFMQKGGAAAAADPFLKVGDRVISIGGQAIKSEQDVKNLAAGPHGTPVMSLPSLTSSLISDFYVVCVCCALIHRIPQLLLLKVLMD